MQWDGTDAHVQHPTADATVEEEMTETKREDDDVA